MDFGIITAMAIPLVGVFLTISLLIIFAVLRRKKRLRFKQEAERLPVINVIYAISGHRTKGESGITLTSMGEYASNLQVGDSVRYYVNTLSIARNGINLSRFDRKSEKPHILGEVINITGNTIEIKGRCRLYNGQFLPENAPFDARITMNIGNWVNLTKSKRRPTFSRKGGFLVDVKNKDVL